jgi:hypothetical protein
MMSLLTTSDFRFLGRYPDARTAAAALVLMTREERCGFCRSFLTEGTPEIFKDFPMLYEAMRDWIADRLSSGDDGLRVEPKEITLFGSARLGYSLTPHPKFGQPFAPGKSDLNIAVISFPLFDALCNEFVTWRRDFESEAVSPSTATEQALWPENILVLGSKISRGFVDPINIPCRRRYVLVRRLKSTMDDLTSQLAIAAGAPKVRRCSIRVFRDWRSCISQMCLNLNRAVPRNETLTKAFFGSGYWDWR